MIFNNKFFYLLTLIAVLLFTASVFAEDTVHTLVLNEGTALLDGASVPEYDYTWHADPSVVHDEVKDAPAEYFTGTKPSGEDPVYIAHDVYYYPEVPAEGFERVWYDDDWEWVYKYPVEEYKDYIWANLPIRGTEVPAEMMHTPEEALNNPVLHITQPGTYELSGSWHGQILVDTGDPDDTFTDENAKVTLILNGAEVTCDVAPALIFYSVYEADNTWEDRENYGPEADISDAGAKVVIADDSVNTFTGTNVYRMLKAKYKNEDDTAEVKTQKKLRKTDAAFYSYQSMLIDGGEKGNGVLNIVSGYEGLDTELHLTINGGKVSIQSQDDGLNVNEDGVSVLTVNGGELHIVAGLGMEGDGVDSNGYLVVNGGVVIAAAKPQSDSGLDSDRGSFVNGGWVIATGSTMDWAETDSKQVTMNLQFAADQASDEAIIVTDAADKVVFAYDPDKDETTGSNNRGFRGAVISSPEFKTGETYHVYVGGDVEGTESDGLYDIATVTGFSGAVRQVYTGTDVRGFGPGGGRPGPWQDGERPEGFPPEPPEGGFPGGRPGPWQDGEHPEGFPPEPPEGGFPGGRPGPWQNGERPEGFPPEPPEGGFPGGRPGPWQNGERPEGFPPEPPEGFPGGEGAGEPSADFLMSDTVNAFSGVKDEEQ